MVLTNGEFRKLISDFSVVARDLAARGAVKVAEGVRPTEDQLKMVDEGERQDHFVESAVPSSVSQAGTQTSPTSAAQPGVPATGQPPAVDQARSEVQDIKSQAQDEARDLQNREGEVEPEEVKGKVAGLFNRVKVSSHTFLFSLVFIIDRTPFLKVTRTKPTRPFLAGRSS